MKMDYDLRDQIIRAICKKSEDECGIEIKPLREKQLALLDARGKAHYAKIPKKIKNKAKRLAEISKIIEGLVDEKTAIRLELQRHELAEDGKLLTTASVFRESTPELKAIENQIAEIQRKHRHKQQEVSDTALLKLQLCDKKGALEILQAYGIAT